MKSKVEKVKLADIYMDESIYPRKNPDGDTSRIARYAGCLRDGDKLPLIKVEAQSKGYRVLDGLHRKKAHQEIGTIELDVEVIDLEGQDPLLFAAHCQDKGKDLGDADVESVAVRAFQSNPRIKNKDIASALGRSESSISNYLKDKRARHEMAQDVKIFKMSLLGISQERIADRLGMTRESVDKHLLITSELKKVTNEQLERGFLPNTIAEKLGWPEPLVWAVALEGKTDKERFSRVGWNIRPWDNWAFNDCDERFGTSEWDGRIPAQLIAQTLYFFTNQGDLILDPMAGGGTTPDVCLALSRQCWSFDKEDRPDLRPEIEPFLWNHKEPVWPLNSKAKPDLIFFDPPYYKKKEKEYKEDSISALPRMEYLNFFSKWAALTKENIKSSTRLAFLMADWRDFQSKAAVDENPGDAINIFDYHQILTTAGWELTHRIETPMSSQRFGGNEVQAMQEKRELGTTGRTLLMFRRSKK